MESLLSLLDRLPQDPIRDSIPFSGELLEAQELLLQATSDIEAEALLRQWLSKFQPCLFGRLASRREQLEICVLRDGDIEQGDAHVRSKIGKARLRWTADGFYGRKSGFVLVCISSRLCRAQPGPSLAEFARRLGYLYLGEEIVLDRVHLDEMFLEIPGSEGTTFRFVAGVNFFAAAGDGRWWQDHRIPGGVAFSVNSVAHMAKSGLLSKALASFAREMGVEESSQQRSGVASLAEALELAMRTIDQAAATKWGPATELLPLPEDLGQLPVHPCPFDLSKGLRDKNYCEYRGYYHTDFTLPSEYFEPDAARPVDQRSFALDLTYLFWDSPENPDHQRMGTGVRIRHADGAVEGARDIFGRGTEIDIKSSPRLELALSADRER